MEANRLVESERRGLPEGWCTVPWQLREDGEAVEEARLAARVPQGGWGWGDTRKENMGISVRADKPRD